MPTDEEVIDLTFSEDEGDDQPDYRRKRTRYDDDDDIILVENDVVAQPNNEPETANPVDDDEVMIVSTNGGDDWTSFPHTRDLCRQCPFTLGMKPTNAKYCQRCFCYVCDCPAAECKEWGNGTARDHHCNATAKSITYRTLRQERLKKNRADRSRPSSASGASRPSSAAAAVAASRPSGAAVAASRPSGAAAAEFALPRPSSAERQIQARDEEDDISYPFAFGYDSPDEDEDSECNCFNCIARREGMGIYFNSGGMSLQRNTVPEKPKPCDLKELPSPLVDPSLIELANLTFEVEVVGNNKISEIAARLVPHGFYRPTKDNSFGEKGDKLTLRGLIHSEYVNHRSRGPFIKIIPTHLTPLPTSPGPTHVVPIRVSFWDGREAPTVYGVTTTEGNTVMDMINKLRVLLNVSDAGVKIIPAYSSPSNDYLKLDERITDEWLSDKVFTYSGDVQLEAFCIPKPRTKPAKKDASRRPPVAWINLVTGAPSSNWERSSTKTSKLVIPIAPDYAIGGNTAKAAVAADIVRALKCFRVNPDDEDETTRLADAANLFWGTRNGQYAVSTPFTEVKSDNSFYQRNLNRKVRALGLRISFPDEVVAASFIPEFQDILPVDASADYEALKTTKEYIIARKAVVKTNADERRLPEQALEEIDDLSQMKDISTIKTVIKPGDPGVGPSAMVRYKAELTPVVTEEAAAAGKGRARKKRVVNESKGILKIRVFVFKLGARNRVGFFDQTSEWGAAAGGRHRQRTIAPHALRSTLWHHLQQNEKFISMENHRKHWTSKDSELSARRSITALMEAMERPEAPAAVQPDGLTVTLRPYQKQSLQFMLEAERVEGGFRKHLWVPCSTVDSTPFWYSPLLGRVVSDVPEQVSGGFNCEEMGLGKTVEILALCLANPAPALPAPGTLLDNGKLKSRATLVVCAVSLVGQWMAEAQEKTGGSMKIYMYHGQGRIKNARRLATDYDLVVTTYATLTSDCGNKTSRANNKAAGSSITQDKFTTTTSPLHQVEWHRLVLDESHTCKNPAVGHTKACIALEAKRRWMCTGTPINTDVQDLYGQFAVLGFAPFNNKNFFDSNVKNAFGNNVYGGGCPELLHALGATMVRHTKRQELGGEQVLQLPPKTEEFVPVILTATEQAVYKRVHETSAEYFSRYERMGPEYVSKNLLHIMSLLLPLRRICSGGALTKEDLKPSEPNISAAQSEQIAVANGNANSADNSAAAAAKLAVNENLVAPANEECPICMDAYEEPAVTTCNHWFCKPCIIEVLQSTNVRCPLCRNPQCVSDLRCGITAADAEERRAAEEAENNAELAASQAAAAEASAAAALKEKEIAIAATRDGLISESKLAALLKSLRGMRRADPTAKALIFSQYNSTIEWLKGRLTREGFGYRHISGSMPLKQRAKAIQAFQGDPPTTVFLLSMRSGAVGINLTAASHVYLLEPALNPALEDQAVGRAWRMGQRREVKVLRFYVKGSVEEQIMEVVKIRQTGVAGAAAAASASAESPYTRRAQRPQNNIRVEDQAGSIKADKQNLRLNELQALFKTPEFPPPRGDEPPSDEDEPMPDAEEFGGGRGGVDYMSLYERNKRKQEQQQWQQDDGGAGTSAMHAAMGTFGHSKAAAMKNRMRRSKAGIASIANENAAAAAAAAAGAAVTPGGALRANNAITNGAGPSNGNTAANGITPAANLPGAPATAAPPPAAAEAEEEVEEEEEVVELPPAAILQRIKLLAQRATGRLTPATNGGSLGTSQRAAAAAAKAANAELADGADTDEDLDDEALEKLMADEEDSPGPKLNRKRGRPLSRGALTAHIPNATPDAAALGDGSRPSSANGRPARRAIRPNYAVLASEGGDAAGVGGGAK